jgi:hypothetical protein
VIGIAVALVFDLGLVPRIGDVDLSLPHHRRQVNEVWLDELRPWVYATGFGAQIGFGLATYIMTTGVYLVILLSALVTPPWVAMLVGAAFGFVRGMAVFASARCRTPAQLHAFHRRFESMTEPVRRAMIGLEAGVGATYAVLAWDVVGVVLVALGVTGAVVWYRRRGPRVPQGVPSGESMAANQRPESLGTRRWVA